MRLITLIVSGLSLALASPIDTNLIDLFAEDSFTPLLQTRSLFNLPDWTQTANNTDPPKPQYSNLDVLVNDLRSMLGLPKVPFNHVGNDKIKGRVHPYRKLALSPFINMTGMNLLEKSPKDKVSARSSLPIWTFADGPSNIIEPAILPFILDFLFWGHGIPTPSWWPIAIPIRFPTLIIGGWVNSPFTLPLVPSQDSFYNPQSASYVNLPLGGVIAWRHVHPNLEWATIDRAYQISFRSEDITGKPEPEIGTAFVPFIHNNKNVLVYHYWQDSSHIDCSTSYSLITGTVDPMAQLAVLAGWVIYLPDHEGRRSTVGVALQAARTSLNAMRAYLRMREPMGISNGVLSLYGYSGASAGAGMALQIWKQYAPELDIRAAAVGGVLTDLEAFAKQCDGQIGTGFTGQLLIGMSRQYPSFDAILRKHAKPGYYNKLMETAQYCFVLMGLNLLGQSLLSTYFDVDIFSLPETQRIVQENRLGPTPLPANLPVLVFNGIQDEFAPIEATQKTVDEWCKSGGRVDFFRNSLFEHLTELIFIEPDVMDWLVRASNGYLPAPCKNWQEATMTSGGVSIFDFSTKADLSDAGKRNMIFNKFHDIETVDENLYNSVKAKIDAHK